MEKRRLREILLDQIEYKNLDSKKVIRQTGIPAEYLNAILEDTPSELPAFPYIRTYLVKLAKVLDLETQEIISAYKREFIDKLSGSADLLPTNRFALPSGRRRLTVLIIALAVIGFGYVISTSSFFGRPQIEIVFPPSDPEPFVVNDNSIELRGRIDTKDTLHINNKLVTVDDGGRFIETFSLSPEINHINFSVKRFLGSDLRVIRQVFYEPISTSTESIIEIEEDL